MRKFVQFLFSFLPLYCFATAEPSFAPSKPYSFSKSERNPFYHPYVGVGVSTFALLPYAGNMSVGIRSAAPHLPVGIDISGNYTTNFASQYYFAKGMIPIYTNQADPLNSYYIAPYLCGGYNTATVRDLVIIEGGWLLMNGVSLGKNFTINDKLSFTQISANFSKLEKENSSRWQSSPTLTFQYGIGF